MGQFRFLIRHQDGRFTNSFDAVFGAEGVRCCTPVRAPQANALAERWVDTVRREVLDRTLIFGRQQSETVVAGSLWRTTTSIGHAARLAGLTAHGRPTDHSNWRHAGRASRSTGRFIHEYA